MDFIQNPKNFTESFLFDLFSNNPYSTNDVGDRFYTVEAFANIYTVEVRVTYGLGGNANYQVIGWKNENER